MNVPDWLWQGLLENAIWTGIVFSAAWVWKRRRAMQGKPDYVSATIQSRSTVKATATVEKPSLARRLEELASWYLHVSELTRFQVTVSSAQLWWLRMLGE